MRNWIDCILLARQMPEKETYIKNNNSHDCFLPETHKDTMTLDHVSLNRSLFFNFETKQNHSGVVPSKWAMRIGIVTGLVWVDWTGNIHGCLYSNKWLVVDKRRNLTWWCPDIKIERLKEKSMILDKESLCFPNDPCCNLESCWLEGPLDPLGQLAFWKCGEMFHIPGCDIGVFLPFSFFLSEPSFASSFNFATAADAAGCSLAK